MSRLLVRRALTAVGMYASVVFGFLGSTIIAPRMLGAGGYGEFATVVTATAFFQSFFDLTVEESLVKYGFRYVTREDWGRLRRLFEAALAFKVAGAVVGAAAMLALAPFAYAIFGAHVALPLVIAAAIPPGQSLEGLAAQALMLRGRYDVRAAFLAWATALRLVGIVVGAPHGVAAAVAGITAAQLLSTASVTVAGWVAFRRFPSAPSRPLGEDRREIRSFVLQSSAATGVISVRGQLAPLILGAVTGTTQLGFFRIAQAPQAAFQTLSAPARMVLLTEQTHDWERGRQSDVLRGVRRYSAAAAVLMAVLSPPLVIFMPQFVHLVYPRSVWGVTDALRVFVATAAVQFIWGWSKSLPVTIGRPNLRIWTHGLEAIVVLPLVAVLGSRWGATGAAVAVLVGMCVYACQWAVIFLRIRAEDIGPPQALDAAAEEAVERGALAR